MVSVHRESTPIQRYQGEREVVIFAVLGSTTRRRLGILEEMEYQVPQFIEVEDKIIGSLTLKQFIYLAGATGLCIIFFMYLHIVIAFLLSAPVAGLAITLSFYKVNGKPFIEVLEAAFNYYTREKLFLWKRYKPYYPIATIRHFDHKRMIIFQLKLEIRR